MLSASVLTGCHSSHSDDNEIVNGNYTVTFNISIAGQPAWSAQVPYTWTGREFAYSLPESVHIDYFCHEASQDKRTGQRNLFGDTNYLTLYEGSFDLLAYNNDFDYITMTYSDGDRRVMASTSENFMPPFAQLPEGQPLHYQPDRLLATSFSLSLGPNINGMVNSHRGFTYSSTVNCQLSPLTTLHLIRVSLLNNEGRVIGCDQALATGFYSSMELYSTAAQGETVCHEVAPYMVGDEVMAQLVTFGAVPTQRQELWLWLRYANGTGLAKVDISQGMATKDGIVFASLDIKNDYPWPTDGGGSGNSGGGLGANVSGWENEENYYIDL